jgi:hypothetical protein
VNHMSETFGGFLRWWWKKKKKKIKPRGDEGGYKRLAPQPRERDIYIPLSKSVVLNLPLFFGQEIRRQVEMGRGQTTPLSISVALLANCRVII